MSDLISRQDAYEVLTEYYHHNTKVQHDALREALDRVPSAEPERKWISVSEELPDEETEVLVTVHFDGYKDKFTNLKPNNYVGIASHIDGEWSSYDDEYKVAPRKHHVIAWMPLPEPWRGDR